VSIFGSIYASQETLYVDPEYQYTISGCPDKKLNSPTTKRITSIEETRGRSNPIAGRESVI
jgi:hypothetical protein